MAASTVCHITTAGATERKVETMDSWEFNCLPFSSKHQELKSKNKNKNLQSDLIHHIEPNLILL